MMRFLGSCWLGKNTRAGRVDLYVQTFLSEIYDDLELVLDLVMMRIPRIMLVGQEYESRESRSVCANIFK